ncbi:hypothetical protein D9M68_643840 [compost metagenome]
MGNAVGGQAALANQLAYLLPLAVEEKVQLLALDEPLARLALLQTLLDRLQGEVSA